MNIYAVPMLISGIFCALLSGITWVFRRRERINRVFAFFTLALALDSFGYLSWFQFGRTENINTWMRIVFTTGFLVPIGVILFFFAFTGYDKKMDSKVLGIRVRHFQVFALLLFLVAMLLAPSTQLLLKVPENPENVWDQEEGPFAILLYPLFAGIFFYLLAMAFKSYKMTASEPRRRFILLLSLGTAVWVIAGFIGAILFTPSSVVTQFINYVGTATMAVVFFVAIVNYQSDRVHELNLNLERKVEERTQQLEEKNSQLENTLSKLKQMQKQVIVQEKMATLGQLVAGLTHEINTPIGTIRSVNETKTRAIGRLRAALATMVPDTVGTGNEIGKVIGVISDADQLIDQGAERLDEIMKNLQRFARLDEAEIAVADIHEGLDSVLALISHRLPADTEVIREYGEIPPFICQPRELNQVFFNILTNACQAIDGKGRITITTNLEDNMVHVAIRDTGKGIKPEDLRSIFDPGFTTRSSVVRTSLGLPICYQIIQEHQGRIDVESEPGEGSVFTVILPMEYQNGRTARE